ncbi:MAG TPA: hypothetical protein VF403_20755 [Kofleriaceae bacterium]
MLIQGIASILHRDTIAVIVGARTFERGEECFTSKRVLEVEAARGELRGRVKPSESQRAHYTCRIWLRDEGVAYECTCPIGVKRQFCKHAVAIALAHLANERAEAEAGLGVLREAMTTIGHPALVEGLIGLAKHDHDLASSLKRMCLEQLSKQT